MKIRLVSLFFIFNIQIGSAQYSVDSLLQVAAQAKVDTVKIDAYNDICWELKKQYPDSALAYGRQAQQMSAKMNYAAGEAKAWNNMAIVYWYGGNYHKAIELLTNANDIYESIDHQRGISVTNVNIGILQMNLSRYKEAVISLNKALAIQEALQDTSLMGPTYNNLGNVYIEIKEFEKAKELYKKALAIKRAQKDETVYLAETNLGVAYKMMGEQDSALYYFSISHEKSMGKDPNSEADNLVNMATVWRDRNEWGKAEAVLKNALEINEKHRNPHKRIYILNTLASVHVKSKKNLNQVPRILTEAEALADSLQNYSRLENCYDYWMQYYELIKNLPKYAWATQKREMAQDSLFSREMRKSLQEVEVKYETERKERQLLTQSLELKTQEAALLTKQNQLTWLGFVVLFLVSGGGLGFYAYRQRQERKMHQAVVEEQNKGIKAVFDGIEEERKRIAKDLHDGVGQQLSGLKLAFQNYLSENENTDKQKADKIIQIVTESATEVRSISHQMMPRTLMELGLIPAMADSLEKYLGNSNIKFDFEHHGLEGRLPERIEVSVYRIFQELVNNIIKHANADHVSIQLIKGAGKLILTVEDNGKGFSGNTSDGLGLWGIKNRLDAISGKISFEVNMESGTSAVIIIPLKNE